MTLEQRVEALEKERLAIDKSQEDRSSIQLQKIILDWASSLKSASPLPVHPQQPL